ncbi:hypothetical protein QBC40DRAFT_349144 [Triangularia verruculosa]|uniref:Uncharacterized protein n=1 Tax=Triangularia verruculosa TaxID=2587418 RepID=A0AAN6XJW3_9PEZI|nr:hypothetical protein QBC40DRAFT_349144 [Triangularia verruculosa]
MEEYPIVRSPEGVESPVRITVELTYATNAAEDIDTIYNLNLAQNFSSPIWNHVFPGISDRRTKHTDYPYFEDLLKGHIRYNQENLEPEHQKFSPVPENTPEKFLDPEKFSHWHNNHAKFNLNGSLIDPYSTIADFFTTYESNPTSQPHIHTLPTHVCQRLPNVTYHDQFIQERILDSFLEHIPPEKEDGPKRLHDGLWLCQNLAIAPHYDLSTRKSALSHLLDFIHDATAIPIHYREDSTIPPGPDPICICLPDADDAIPALLSDSWSRGTIQVPFERPKLYFHKAEEMTVHRVAIQRREKVGQGTPIQFRYKPKETDRYYKEKMGREKHEYEQQNKRNQEEMVPMRLRDEEAKKRAHQIQYPRPRSFYLIAEVFNPSTGKQELVATACFEWITKHHTAKASRAHIAYDRTTKAHCTLIHNIKDSHLEPEHAAEARKQRAEERRTLGEPQEYVSVAIDANSTSADFFTTYHTLEHAPQIPNLERPFQKKLSHPTQHYETLQHRTLDSILGPEKTPYPSFLDLLYGSKIFPGLWHCHSLGVSPSPSIPDLLKRSAVSHILAWMQGAASLPLSSPPNNAPAGPECICLSLPAKDETIPALIPTSIGYQRPKAERVPIVPPGVLDIVKQKLGGSKDSREKKDQDLVVVYNMYLFTPQKRQREMWQQCLYKPAVAKQFYEEQAARGKKEADEAREKYQKEQEKLEEKKKKKERKASTGENAGSGGGDSRARNAGHFQGPSGLTMAVTLFNTQPRATAVKIIP